MYSTRLVIYVFLALVVGVGCAGEPPLQEEEVRQPEGVETGPREEPATPDAESGELPAVANVIERLNGEADVRVAENATNAFAVDLYRQLSTREGNLFFSPFSLSSALAMTYAGAEGQTAAEMAKVLHFPTDQMPLHRAFGAITRTLDGVGAKGACELSVANALWPQKDYTFLEDFITINKMCYGAELTPLDFIGATEEARTTINDWTEDKTQGKIKDLIPAGVLDPLTRLVLTNAVYFKGQWAAKFDPARTQDADFHVSPTETVTVPMMSRKGTVGYLESETLQGVELPYADDELSMVILLPRAQNGLAEFEASLSSEQLDQLLTEIHTRDLIVMLPRFTMTQQFRLKDKLTNMGMPTAFSKAADLSGMTGDRDLFISAVLHKAFVDVNEEGTEAAAATAVVVALKAVSMPLEFRADHPFLFLIRHRPTGAILFMGRVVLPGA